MAEPFVRCDNVFKIYKIADLEIVALQGLDLAVAEYRRVLSGAPDHAGAHFNLAQALLRLRAVGEARAHLTRYLELDVDSEWAATARRQLRDPRLSTY